MVPVVGNRTRPLALGEHDLVGIVDQMLVTEHFEESDRLLFMGIPAIRRWLIRLAYDAVLRVITPEGFEILGVPRIVERLHILQILRGIHSSPHSPQCDIAFILERIVNSCLG